MQSTCKKYSDQTSAILMSPSIVTCPSRWNSSGSQFPQSSLSNTRSLDVDVDSPQQQCYKLKQLGHQLQDQDSSSTQSTGQSHQEVETTEGGFNGIYRTQEEGHMKSVFTLGNPSFIFPSSQHEYSQTFARTPYPYPDPCFGGMLTPCGPQAIIHPPIMGIVPARVPLPLNIAEAEPIFVNAKQYRAIIRRREARAKLEAQNKLVKARKPYLHESRHLHALKRVRGSGGRFVNTKQQEQSKPTSTANRQNTLGLSLPQRNRNWSESEFHSETSEVGASTSCSEITDLSNNDYMLRQQQHMFSSYVQYMPASPC